MGHRDPSEVPSLRTRVDTGPAVFQNSPVKADKFESLSDEALYALADKMGLDLPPALDRVFVVEEILGAIEEDSLERRSGRMSTVRIEEAKFSSSELDEVDPSILADSPMPKTYNETAIKVLVRDPSWAFAFWDISDNERQALVDGEWESSLFLRVFELPEGAQAEAKKEFFDIPVAIDDFQWYINLPKAKARYRIELCARTGGKLKVLARSRDAWVPRQFLDSPIDAIEGAKAELLRLSGIESLDIEPEGDVNTRRILLSEREGD